MKRYVIGPHGITFEHDVASDTFALAIPMRIAADRQLPDGQLACLVDAREHHAAGRTEHACALLCLVHYRAIELQMPAVVEHCKALRAELLSAATAARKVGAS